MLVNGLVYPTAHVEQRKYRLRLLNACNARFCTLRLFYAQSPSFPGSTEPNLHQPGPSFVQIGTEGGFLPHPVVFDGTRNSTLLLAPAERADVIVDFSGVPAGSILILYNDARRAISDGRPGRRLDSDDRNTSTPTQPGFGPDTRTLAADRGGPARRGEGSVSPAEAAAIRSSAARADWRHDTAAGYCS